MPAIEQHIQTQKGKDTQLLISASKYRVLNAHGRVKIIGHCEARRCLILHKVLLWLDSVGSVKIGDFRQITR